MIVGTAGHIDHGKTTLIKALTGVDADRLKEEKERGITIDLGFAYYALPDSGVLGFVDVPGHERFVHNMLAGATGIDCVLLLVAADDGVMPQTREHLEIIDLLGISSGLVALSKIDRVDAARVAEVKSDIHSLLGRTRLAGCPIFALSGVTGEGIEALRRHLERCASQVAARRTDAYFRLAVDRCFTLTGAGTIATGTVFAGRVRVGDRLLVSPSGTEVRVRAIHAQNRESETGEAGQRCALNLAGIEKNDVARGDWLVAAPLHRPCQRFDTRIQVARSAARALRHWAGVHVHLGAANVAARVSVLEGTGVEPGRDGLVQLVLDRPVGVLHGDRFILRDQSARTTLAGGVVLQPFAPARRVRTPQRLALLGALEREPPRAALASLLEISMAGVDLNTFACSHNLLPDAMESMLRTLPVTTVATVGGGRLGFAPACWASLKQAVLDNVAAEHRSAPELLGIQARPLRRRVDPQLAWEAFLVLVEALCSEGCLARHGPWLHLPGHRVMLTAAEERLWRAVAPLLRATPFQPPWIRDLARVLVAPEAQVRALMQRVTVLGDVYEVVHDRFFLREAVARIVAIASEIAAETGMVRAAQLRDHIGTGRRLAIQILEFLDRTGASRRIGDAHRLRVTELLVDGPAVRRADRVSAPGSLDNGRDTHPGGAT